MTVSRWARCGARRWSRRVFGNAGRNRLTGSDGSLSSENGTTTANSTNPTDAADEAESPYTQVYQGTIQSVVLLNVTTAEGTGQRCDGVQRTTAPLANLSSRHYDRTGQAASPQQKDLFNGNL